MNNPLYSIPHVHHVEIEDKANSAFGQLQIGEHLRSVYWRKAIHCLDLDDHAIGNQEVQPESRFKA
jgi:hypothetical protein